MSKSKSEYEMDLWDCLIRCGLIRVPEDFEFETLIEFPPASPILIYHGRLVWLCEEDRCVN
jgi:hypothetical protein